VLAHQECQVSITWHYGQKKQALCSFNKYCSIVEQTDFSIFLTTVDVTGRIDRPSKLGE
jgi:hypothetical protein